MPSMTALLTGALLLAGAIAPSPPARSLLARESHLGVAGVPEWDAFVGRTPAGESLALTFDGEANASEYTLLIRQSDVKQEWTVDLNGRPLGSLVRMEADLVHALAIPPGALRTGTNTLHVVPATKVPDDIVLHDMSIRPQPVEAALMAARLHVTVTGDDGAPTPARVTVLDADGAMAALRPEQGATQAVRPGVAYTGGEVVRLGSLPGTYRLVATRGPEFSRHEVTVSVAAGETRNVSLRLTREVPTEGWVAADTHIHTLELSGHGDASLRERMLTLAGEGVELAIATEHNRLADYAPALGAAGVADRVTVVPGNEVTTSRGHFNVFPASRAVTVLNHPHDVHAAFSPFARANFNVATGQSRGLQMPFDAMEVVNSGAMRTDWMEPVRSWFALLNRGLRVTPVGASDSHDVSRFIVGQGRTYVRAADARPGRIDVGEAVESVRAGRVVVSLGLFPDVRVGAAGPGDLTSAPDALAVDVRVLGASWIAADRVTLFVNGRPVQQATIDPAAAARVEKATVRWMLPARRHDYHVVVIASGPGVTDPSWAIARPYQPSSTTWSPVVFGLSAPVWVDADGDGAFTSARDYAARLVAAHAALPALLAALADHDAVVSAHVAEVLVERGLDLSSDAARAALAAAAAPVQEGFASYTAAR